MTMINFRQGRLCDETDCLPFYSIRHGAPRLLMGLKTLIFMARATPLSLGKQRGLASESADTGRSA
jgi:hypothetical protein